MLEQYTNNVNTTQFINNIGNQTVDNLTKKYITDLQYLIYQGVDSIKFDLILIHSFDNVRCCVAIEGRCFTIIAGQK